MARFYEPTAEQEAGYRAWVASRPATVRAVAERFEPWSLYRLQSTGQRVTVAAFGVTADGTVTVSVNVLALFNFVTFERQVFGIHPDELEPCELPAPDEPTGALLTAKEVDDNLDALRVAARPDLWTMEDGKAVRKH